VVTYGLSILLILGMECTIICFALYYLFVFCHGWVMLITKFVCCAGLLNVEFPKLLIGSLHFLMSLTIHHLSFYMVHNMLIEAC
jgi:hypothetical protein